MAPDVKEMTLEPSSFNFRPGGGNNTGSAVCVCGTLGNQPYCIFFLFKYFTSLVVYVVSIEHKHSWLSGEK